MTASKKYPSAKKREVKRVDKVKLVLDVIQKLLKVAEDLKNLSESVQSVCTVVSEGLSPEEEQEQEQIEDKSVEFEKVRGVLANKSREGHTAKIKEIIKKYGADKLSEVDPKDYPAILKEVEGLKDE